MPEGTPTFITKSYEALSRGDLDGWLDAYSADVELHDPPDAPGTRVYRGHREAREWAEGMIQMTPEWRWTLEEVVLNEGNTMVFRSRLVGQSRAGVPIDFAIFHLIDIEGDKVTSVRGFFDRPSAIEAAGLSES